MGDCLGATLYARQLALRNRQEPTCLLWLASVESHLLVVLAQLDVLLGLVVDHPDDAAVDSSLSGTVGRCKTGTLKQQRFESP